MNTIYHRHYNFIKYEIQQSYLPQEAYPSAQETKLYKYSFLSNIYLGGY